METFVLMMRRKECASLSHRSALDGDEDGDRGDRGDCHP